MSKLKAHAPELTVPGKPKALIFGPAGIGKTWFSLSFPKPYYIDTEGGADLRHYQERLKAAGGAYMGPQDGALDFGEVIEQVKALGTEKHEYRTLIIDSVTKLYQTAIAGESERLGDKDAFGASKKPAIAMMRQLVRWAGRIDMTVLFVAHETVEWAKSEKTGQREEVGKTPDIWDKLMYELHLAIQVQKRGAKRLGLVRKSRLIGFPELETFDLEFSAFADRYGKDFITAEQKPLVLASSEQVAEIRKLLEAIKLPEGEFEKVLTKANASSIEELSEEHATKTVGWLKKKIE